MKNIRIFISEIFHFLVVKFSICLNRRVFIMNMTPKLEIRARILKILWKRGEIAPNLSSFPQYFVACW